MTESQKKEWEEKFSPTWYKKGQVSPMKGKKISDLYYSDRSFRVLKKTITKILSCYNVGSNELKKETLASVEYLL